MAQNKFRKVVHSFFCLLFCFAFVFGCVLSCQIGFANAEMFSSAKGAVVVETTTKRKLFATVLQHKIIRWN